MRKRLSKKVFGDRTSRRTKFINAALGGNQKRMLAMLSKGFDINDANDEGETAFSWCCQHNKLRPAQFLYKLGADINQELSGNCSPLDVAVCWASPYFRKWLKSVGGERLQKFEPWPWPPPKIN